MDDPNSIIIFFPLLSTNEEFKFLSDFKLKNYDDSKPKYDFKNFEKVNLILDKPFFTKKYQKQLFIEECPLKLNLILDLFKIESFSALLNKKIYLHFIKLEIYSKHFISYVKFIQHYYNKKENFTKFILEVLENEMEREKYDFLSPFIEELIKNSFLIHFNILYFNYGGVIQKLAKIYKTGKSLIDEHQFEIVGDRHGKTLLWINKIKTTHSSKNMKIMVVRSFLLRLFTWMDNKNDIKKKFINIFYDFFSYLNYLLNHSVQRDFYSQLNNHKFYDLQSSSKIRFSRKELQKKLISLKSEDEFRKEVLIPILNDLGYKDVQETHGAHEYGVDILFRFDNNFGFIEWNCIVAKIGNINLDEGTDLSRNLKTISKQTYQAKNMEHLEKNYGDVKITRVFIATNEKINYNAIQALKKKDPDIEGNVFFIDRDVLLNLC